MNAIELENSRPFCLAGKAGVFIRTLDERDPMPRIAAEGGG